METTLHFADQAPMNETPTQKFARLREAANRAKLAQVTRWDYMYLYGRLAADAAHRATVYGIVFATGCLSVLAVFAIGDMVVYNRRKRSIYFENQEIEQARILSYARDAVSEGTATPAQVALVEGITEEERLWQERVAEKKLNVRLLKWMYGEFKEDKTLKEQRRLAVEDYKQKVATTEQGGFGITQAVQEARAASATAPLVQGGELDQQAAKAAAFADNVTKGVSKGWFGWILGGSKKE